LPFDDGIVERFMSANPNPSSIGKKLGLAVGLVLAGITVFVVVMCTAGSPGFLQPKQDMPAPNN
jgi:hypothetical protein